jgi:hypothetical protein
VASSLSGGERTFPFTPRSTRELRIGDIIAVPVGEAWGCLQVADLAESGPGSRSVFIAAVVAYDGLRSPTVETVLGRPILEQAMTRVEMFTEGGLKVVGNCAVTSNPHSSNFRDHGVGVVHYVWGWKAAIGRAAGGIVH